MQEKSLEVIERELNVVTERLDMLKGGLIMLQ